MIRIRWALILLLAPGVATPLPLAAGKDRNPLCRVWIFQRCDVNGAVYMPQPVFEDSRPGIQFKANGVWRVRQNTSFCGTPPVEYETVRGSWKMLNDSSIALEYPFWGGHMSRKVQVMKLTQDLLILVDLDRP